VWARVTLAALYLLSVGLLFASRVREFADETDNLLGGLLLARGERLYVDYFSSHMPLAYYLAAIPALFGASTLDQFRLFSNALLVAATLIVIFFFRHRFALPVLGIWSMLTVFGHTLQWGEMLTAGTVAGFGVLAAGLIFLTTPRLDFSRRQLVGLSAAVFVAIESELVAAFPLVLLGATYVGVQVMEARTGEVRAKDAITSTARLITVVAVPHALVLLGFWLSGSLPAFIFDAYQFNVTEYAQFVMNPSVLGMLHDWEAQYRTYLLLGLQEPLGIQAALILANFMAAWVVFRSRGLLVAALYYLFVALTHVRNEGAYYLCSYFSLALDITYALGVLRQRQRRIAADTVLAGAALLVSLGFVSQVALIYDFSQKRIDSSEILAVRALTSPGEKIFLAPYDPIVYLATQRMPASRYPFYFPWQAIDAQSENTLISDLEASRPPVVIFRSNELVNGRWRTGEYGARVYDFLASTGYAPLDTGSSMYADVLVRQDRLLVAREELQMQPLSATRP